MILREQLLAELSFKTSRSSGPGGQNVNKVESRVAALWTVADSAFLSDAEKEIVMHRLSTRINSVGVLSVESSESRSQLENKEIAVDKLLHLLDNALKPRKKRVATKISKAKVLERLDRKKMQATKKKNRKWRME